MTKHPLTRSFSCVVLASLLAACPMGSSAAPRGATGAAAARLRRYFMASKAGEMALARSAAPASISARAAVLVLGTHGYVTAAKGRNGFVCIVERSWANPWDVKRATFWNARFRAPICFNAAAAGSVLPRYLMRTRWVLAGASRSEIRRRMEAAWAAGELEEPLAGAMSYMMSRSGRGIGGSGPWRPHLMFYFPRAQAPVWGANSPGVPVFSGTSHDTTVFFVLVPTWSDGTVAPRFKS
jgi:hypothetical protein